MYAAPHLRRIGMKRYYKKILPLLLSCALALSSGGCSQAADKAEETAAPQPAFTHGQPLSGGMENVAESGGRVLTLDAETGRFTVSEAGAVCYESNPDPALQDSVAQDVWANVLKSQLVVEYCNSNGNNKSSSNSYTYCVLKDTYEAYRIDGGFAAKYTFEKQGITLWMYVRLTAGALQVTVPAGEITVANGNFLVTGVQVLPFFSASQAGRDGYILLPDGPGGMVPFSADAPAASYSAQLYSTDAAVTKDRSTTREAVCSMPVFGAGRPEGSYLAVITGCDAVAQINAMPAGTNTSYYTVYPSFALRAFDSFQLTDWSGNTSQNVVVEGGGLRYGNLEITYYLLPPNADMTQLADAYRSHLIQQEGMEQSRFSNDALQLTLYGAVQKEKSVLGVPVTLTQTLTGYEWARKTAESLKSGTQQELSILYRYADNASVKHKPLTYGQAFSPLGTKKQLEQLKTAVGEQNLFVEANATSARYSGLAFWSLGNTVKNLLGMPAYRYPYDLASGLAQNEQRQNLHSAQKVVSLLQSYVEAAQKKGEGALAFGDLGTALYSDFDNSRRTNRQELLDAYRSLLAEMPDCPILLSGGAAYTWAYADVVNGLPVQGSGSRLVARTVPFAQLTLRGYKKYVSEPVNLSANPTQAFLDAVATQSTLSFALVGSDLELLKNTELSGLCSGNLSMWEADLLSMSARHHQVVSALEGAKATGCDFSVPQVSALFFDNGAALYVNYSADAADCGGQSVPGRDFILVQPQKEGEE